MTARRSPIEAIAANNVVDGLVLQRKWKAAGTVAGLFADLAAKPDPAQLARAEPQLQLALNALDEAADAVSDALLAESVHHAVQGNPSRAAATLDAIATGDAPPPDLDVVKTPRTGTAITHRLVTVLDGSLTVPPGWASPAIPHRANAEPRLNAWAATLLAQSREGALRDRARRSRDRRGRGHTRAALERASARAARCRVCVGGRPVRAV